MGVEVKGPGEQQSIDPRPTLILILEWILDLAYNLSVSHSYEFPF